MSLVFWFLLQLCGGFTSFANTDPSCVGQVIQEHCSFGMFTAAVRDDIFYVQKISKRPWRGSFSCQSRLTE